MEKELSQQALDALESYANSPYIRKHHPKRFAAGNSAIEALRKAIEQPVPRTLLWCEFCGEGYSGFCRVERGELGCPMETIGQPVPPASADAAANLVEMVDAAMVEMANIHPPLRRSECQRLILAAIASFYKTAPPSDTQTLDAARYQWLRKQVWNDANLFVIHGSKDLVRLGTDCPSFHRLDDAIDAAMAQPVPPVTESKPCFMCQGKGWHYMPNAYPPGTPAPEIKTVCSQCTGQPANTKETQ